MPHEQLSLSNVGTKLVFESQSSDSGGGVGNRFTDKCHSFHSALIGFSQRPDGTPLGNESDITGAISYLNKYKPLTPKDSPNLLTLNEDKERKDNANYLASLVSMVSYFLTDTGTDADSFLAQSEPFFNNIKVRIGRLPIEDVVNQFFRTSKEGDLLEQIAVEECLRRFTEYNKPGVKGIDSVRVPDSVIDSVMKRVSNRPNSTPVVGTLLNEAAHRVAASTGNSEYLLDSLISAAVSPKYGSRSDDLIKRYFPTLYLDDPARYLNLEVAWAKRKIYENPKSNITLIAASLASHVTRIITDSGRFKDLFNDLYHTYSGPIGDLTQAMKRVGREEEVQNVVEIFRAAYIYSSFWRLTKPIQQELLSAFGSDNPSEYIKSLTEIDAETNPDFSKDIMGLNAQFITQIRKA